MVKNYTDYDFLNEYALLEDKNIRILNVGSSSVRYGENCINVDIQNKPNVDVICDIHNLPDSLGNFDVIICNAVLQYCSSPKTVAQQFFKVLRPGGYLFVDAPWVQPYCTDTPDKFRFSKDGLRTIFSDFEIVETMPSIRPGTAFAMLGIQIANNLTPNKYINFILAKITTVLLYPFCRIKTNREEQTAGAFYMICKKRV